MNDNEREMDLALAEAEQENRLLRARNERLERELAGQVALDKMAENARELGLDYEAAPVQDEFDIRGMLASKLTCWNRLRETEANELVALVASLSQPAPVQEPVEFGMHGEKMMFKVGVQQFTLDYKPDTQDEFNFMRDMLVHAFSTFTPDVKTTPPAQPAAPDAIHHTDLSESLEYIQGWNDCRQAMMEMMK